MRVLPVLDLCAGLVVHARGGQREHYLPLASSFGFHSSPLARVAELLQWYPFRYLYVADLDAIRGEGDNSPVIGAITRGYPELELWVDAGAASRERIKHLFALGVARPVVGTETLPDIGAWRQLQAMAGAEHVVLSLDFRGGRFLGPLGLEQQPALWPATVIAMSLDQVGSKAGPDWALLERLRQKRLPGGALLAAGGIRGLGDLMQLAGWGASGVLLASALYDGSVGAMELQQLPVKRAPPE